MTASEPKELAVPEEPENGWPEGIYERMSFEDYAAVPALNGSKILHMRRSPMKYKHERDNPTPPSPAMELGTLVHRMVLEPGLVGEIAVWGELEEQKVRRGKVWDAFREQNEGMLILTVQERDEILAMTASVLRNKPIRQYANAIGPTEVSLFWRHPVTNRRFKARIDKVVPESNTIFDLKTTRDCHSFRFGSQSYALGYHIKMALYAQGWEILTGKYPEVRLGAVDSKPPHESTVYRVTKDVLQQGAEDLNKLVYRIEKCEKERKWPAENEGETDLLLPQWAFDSQFDVEDTM